jgi:acetoin utilization deacetylase AcuC-like enzyme
VFGQAVSDGVRVVHHPAYEVDIGPHVFPTAKYRLVRERLATAGVLAPADLAEPSPVADDDVLLVHTPEYVGKLRGAGLSPLEEARLEVPYSAALRDMMWLCTGGTYLTGQLALAGGASIHIGGGFHHAFPDHGEGFCLINDVAIAIRMLQRDGVIHRALVIDLDVHQGNGTAAVFSEDDGVFTFSMHQQHNYPAWKPPSDRDIGLPDGAGDDEYLSLVDQHLPEIVERHRPDLAFYLAGADPYEEDQLGGLALTRDGLRRRDDTVLAALRAAGIPAAVTLAGGYARHPADTVEIHAGTVESVLRTVGT